MWGSPDPSHTHSFVNLPVRDFGFAGFTVPFHLCYKLFKRYICIVNFAGECYQSLGECFK